MTKAMRSKVFGFGFFSVQTKSLIFRFGLNWVQFNNYSDRFGLTSVWFLNQNCRFGLWSVRSDRMDLSMTDSNTWLRKTENSSALTLVQLTPGRTQYRSIFRPPIRLNFIFFGAQHS